LPRCCCQFDLCVPHRPGFAPVVPLLSGVRLCREQSDLRIHAIESVNAADSVRLCLASAPDLLWAGGFAASIRDLVAACCDKTLPTTKWSAFCATDLGLGGHNETAFYLAFQEEALLQRLHAFRLQKSR